MSVGITQFGVPVYPSDCCDWDMSGGYLQSPTCIADRAAAIAAERAAASAAKKAAAEVDSKMSGITSRLDMTGIEDVEKATTIGDLKLTVNKIKAKVGGTAVPTVLSCFLAMMSFAGEIGVWKANINDVGDSEIVTNVTVTGSFVSSATQLTEKVEFFDNIRTNYEQDVTTAFSNAVSAVTPEVVFPSNVAVFAGVHDVPSGSKTNVIVSAGDPILYAVSDSSGNQRVAGVALLRVSDLTDIWIGGTVENGKVTGGETAYGMVSRMIEDQSGYTDDVSFTGALETGTYIGSLSVGPSNYPVRVPSVSVTPTLSSGASVGVVSVGGNPVTLFAPEVSSRALEVGTDTLYMDSGLRVQSFDNRNTEAWNVYFISTTTNVWPSAISYDVLYTNLMCTCVLTNKGSALLPSYAWEQHDTSDFKPGIGSPYRDNPSQMGCAVVDFNLRYAGYYAKVKSTSSDYTFFTLFSYSGDDVDPYRESIETGFTTYGIMIDSVYNHVGAKWLFLRATPAEADLGQVVSESDIETIKAEVAEIVGQGGAIRGSGVYSNSFIRYDGTAARTRLEPATNRVTLVTKYTGSYSGSKPVDLALEPASLNSWTGQAYMATSLYGYYNALYTNVLVSVDDDGMYSVAASRFGFYSMVSTGEQTVEDGSVTVKMKIVDNDSYDSYGKALFYFGSASREITGTNSLRVPVCVAYSNDLSSVAYTGVLQATNELNGGTVPIEPYTTDGVNVLWRVK